MKKSTSPRLLLFGMIGCFGLLLACQTQSTESAPPKDPPPQTQVLNKEEQVKAQKEALQREFKLASHLDLDMAINLDLNGDGKLDRAEFLTEKGKAGIRFTDGLTRNTKDIGLGTPFGDMGDDFSWVDHWGIVMDREVKEYYLDKDGNPFERNIVIKNPAIVLRQDEVGGGLICFIEGHWYWIQQGS